MNFILGTILGWLLCSLVKNTEIAELRNQDEIKTQTLNETKDEYKKLQELYNFMRKS